MVEIFGCKRLLFSPEFLRDGKALYDNLHHSRIVPNRMEPALEDVQEKIHRRNLYFLD